LPPRPRAVAADQRAAEADHWRAEACGEAGQRVSAAEADRDQALARAGQAELTAQLAQQDTIRAQATEQPSGPKSAGSAPTRTR